MTKKHFIAIAELLAWHQADIDLIEGFENYFISLNPNFDKQRFRAHIMDTIEEMDNQL